MGANTRVSEQVNLEYVGPHVYHESGTALSSIYRRMANGCYERFDWGFVNRELAAGNTVLIRQAGPTLRHWVEERLQQFRKQAERAALK